MKKMQITLTSVQKPSEKFDSLQKTLENKVDCLQNIVEDLHKKFDKMEEYICEKEANNITNPTADEISGSSENTAKADLDPTRLDCLQKIVEDLHNKYHKMEEYIREKEANNVTNPTADEISGSSEKRKTAKPDLGPTQLDCLQKIAEDLHKKFDKMEELAVRIGRTGAVRFSPPISPEPTIPPLKKKKLNFLAYDPYRELDPYLLENYDKWVDEADESSVVTVVDSEISLKALKCVVDGGVIGTNIMDSAMCEVRRRMNSYPDLFEKDACVFDSYFLHHVKMLHNGKKGSPKTIENYVKGTIPSAGKPWIGCRYFYAPVLYSSHWFSVRIDITERKISVYDSAPSHIRMGTLGHLLEPLIVVFPHILKETVDGCENYGEEKFSFEKVKGLPVQTNGVDCGMFALKWIEFLIEGQDVRSLRVDHITEWRKKLVVELWAMRFEPIRTIGYILLC